MAIKVVSAILGFIAAVLVYPWFNQYVFALIAFLGAIAVGIIVYVVATNVIAGLVNDSRRL